MTLDEAIKHCDEKAKELREKTLDMIANGENPKERADCLECAKEHEQLAEWLKDYKRLLEEIEKREQEQAKMLDDMNKEYNKL